MKSLSAVFATLSLLALSSLAGPVYAAESSDHTVTCKDGTTSHAGKGACSHHGGVEKGGASTSAQAKKKDEKKDETSDKPTAKCKDGTTSHAKEHGGPCSQHGGVDAP